MMTTAEIEMILERGPGIDDADALADHGIEANAVIIRLEKELAYAVQIIIDMDDKCDDARRLAAEAHLELCGTRLGR